MKLWEEESRRPGPARRWHGCS